MSKIHFLPVRHGDAFIIECTQGDAHGLIVIDGGLWVADIYFKKS